MGTVRIIGALPQRPSWTDRLTTESWRYWKRLEALLRSDPKLEQSQVDSVSAESLRVLQYLPDPKASTPFQGRGLVVGYVQSGKTANYTAVAARAVDAGYQMVIVLSGIHDSLRNQTQKRLERELTGNQVNHLLEQDDDCREWITLTTPTEDFQKQDGTIIQSTGPFLAVVKKNVSVLQKLDCWLESSASYLDNVPVLIIDDEADQASINTKGNRPLDAAVGDEDEDDENLAPSRTNGLIRSILKRTKKAAYVAYTATPFANILINPEGVDRRVGEELFPKDFVIQLPRPKGYTGTEELFGASAQGRDVLRTVAEEDVKALRGSRKRRKTEIVLEQAADALPNSLADALVSFCLAGGVRILRGLQGKSHTMLVHVSQRTDDQSRIADAIRDQLDLWREAERQGQRLEFILEPVWREMKAGIDVPADDEAVLTASKLVLRELVVLELNSVTGENLEYDEKPGRQIVAVGGNRLSRGLTLEGLTVSYFLRTASMCDTLLQMARWYGFRRGYEDLIRIWTTDGIARWFSELALVEQSLRDSIIALARAGRRPDQMAIRLRAHSDLLLTARNKSGTKLSQQDSWSGEHPQTVLLPLSDPAKLQSNFTLTDRFIEAISPSAKCHGGILARDVPPETIAAFLRGYQIHEDIVVFRNDLLADWIMGRSTVGELSDWSVFVASPADGKSTALGGREIGLVRRKRVSSESIGILTDPAHEGLDLPRGPDAYKRDSGAYDAEAMRAARPSTQGLLLIYPLDPEYLGIPSSEPVIALALSLPQTSDAGTTWIMNSMVSNG
jgi:hypothetical protein